jgi:hypothetical protein
MKPAQYNLTEILLAVAFVGLFAVLAVGTWGGFFFIHGLVTAAVLMVPAYLLLVLVIRRHCPWPDDLRKH